MLEHVLFYARLKGTENEYQTALRAIQQVELNGYENQLSKALSGGAKRRLSIAISLIGNPKVVFLDEPTVTFTANRRLDWTHKSRE